LFFLFGGFVAASFSSRGSVCSFCSSWRACLASGRCVVSAPVPSPFALSRSAWVASGGPGRVFPSLPVPPCVPCSREVALSSGSLPVWLGRSRGWLFDGDDVADLMVKMIVNYKKYSVGLSNVVSHLSEVLL
jgi:hypothetical protein